MKTALLLTLGFSLSIFTPLFAQWSAYSPGSVPNHLIISVAPVSETVAWGALMSGNTFTSNQFVKTKDGGATWTLGTMEESAFNAYPAHIFALDENTAWATRIRMPDQQVTEILHTTDGGDTWTPLNLPAPNPVFAGVATHFFNANEGFIYGETNTGSYWHVGCFYTQDGGATWQVANAPVEQGERIWVYSGNGHFAVRGDTAWFGTSLGRIFRSTDEGVNWEAFETGLPNRTFHTIAFKDNLNGIAASIWDNDVTLVPNKIVRTTDGGKTWTESPVPASPYIGGLAHVPGSDGAYIIVSDHWTGSYAISRDNGNHWTTLTDQKLDCVQFASPAVGWAGGTNMAGTSPAVFKWAGDNLAFDPSLINVKTFAGSGMEGHANGAGLNSRFANPKGMCMDRQGNIYVADDYNHRIRKIAPNGTVSDFAGSGIGGYADGEAQDAQFRRPQDVVADSEGNLFVADASNSVIRKITPDGMVSLYAGIPGHVGNMDGSALHATFGWINGIAIDGSGNLYAMDNALRQITPEGTVSTLYTIPGGDFAWNVHADAAGNVYWIEFSSGRVKKLSTEGVVSVLAGGSGCTDGQGSAAGFSFAEDLTTDALGNIYIADGTNRRVRKLDLQGNVTTLAGDDCQRGYAVEDEPVDGAGAVAQFGRLRGILCKPDGNLLVTSWSDDMVREVQLGNQPPPLSILESVMTNDYTITPLTQVQPINFYGTAFNHSEDLVENVWLTLTIRKDGIKVFEQASSTASLPASMVETLEISTAFTPNASGEYEATFIYEMAGMGVFHKASKSFSVSDSLYSNDDGLAYTFNDVDFSSPNCIGAYGVVFDMPVGDTLKGFSVRMRAENAAVFMQVYSMENGAPGELLLTTDTVSELSFPVSNFYHAFHKNYYLPSGQYLFVINRPDSTGSIGMGMDSDAADQSAWYLAPCYGANDWTQEFTGWSEPYGPSYMIRPVFTPPFISGTNEVEASSFEVLLSPNPVSNEVQLKVNAMQGAAFLVEIFDLNGRLVRAFEMQDGGATVSVGVTDLSTGSYVVKVFNEKAMAVARLVKI